MRGRPFFLNAMKKSLCAMAFLLFLFSSHLTAQKEDNVWILGGSGGGPDSSEYRTCKLEFMQDTAKGIFINENIAFGIFNACISSKSGDFQCFSIGERIINRVYKTMENGDNLYPNANYSDGCPRQNYLLLPKPKDSTRIVHINGDTQLLDSAPFGSKIADVGIFYAEIDVTANNSLGKVVLRNKKIGNDTLSTFGYSACRHGNGRDWWILASNSHDTTIFYRYLLDPTGLRRIGSQNINSTYRGIGSSFYSPDGQWFASFMEWGVTTPYKSTFNLYKFDRCTGLLSDRIRHDFPGGNKPGGVAFSDDSHFLYVSVWDTIYQYDLQAPDLLASEEVVAVYDGFKDTTGKWTTFFSMLLAPDKKIYVCTANSNTRYMHVIEHPEKKGVACSVKQHAVFLPAYNSSLIPNMPYYRLYDWKDSPCDTIGSVATEEPDAPLKNAFSLHPNPATDHLQILFPQPTTAPAQCAIIDLGGKKWRTLAVPPGSSSFSVATGELPPGLYFVQILGENGRFETQKLVISD